VGVKRKEGRKEVKEMTATVRMNQEELSCRMVVCIGFAYESACRGGAGVVVWRSDVKAEGQKDSLSREWWCGGTEGRGRNRSICLFLFPPCVCVCVCALHCCLPTSWTSALRSNK